MAGFGIQGLRLIHVGSVRVQDFGFRVQDSMAQDLGF